MAFLAKSKWVVQLCRNNICLSVRAVYSGPESTPDYTKNVHMDNKSWEAKKLKNLRQRVIDKGNNVQFSGMDKLVDDELKKVISLPHLLFTDNSAKYAVKDEKSRIVIGKAVPQTKKPYDSNIKLDPDFARPEVQALLKKITGKDLDKVYRTLQSRYQEMPRIRLLTEQQLKEEYEASMKQAEELLTMPPIMKEREIIDDVLAEDDELDGYEHSNIVFTDISDNLCENNRFIVVREPSGRLRKATWDERDRMIQTYYTKPHRTISKPKLFDDLKVAFEHKLHENVLEQIVVQYEPDAAQFIKLTAEVYDDVNTDKLFDLLRSTRFFGGLAFHLAKYRVIDNMLTFFIEKDLICEAADLVNLFVLLHPDSATSMALNSAMNDLDKIKVYLAEDAEDTISIRDALNQHHSPVDFDATTS